MLARMGLGEAVCRVALQGGWHSLRKRVVESRLRRPEYISDHFTYVVANRNVVPVFRVSFPVHCTFWHPVIFAVTPPGAEGTQAGCCS